MSDPFDPLTQLLSDVVLPNLKVVQLNQAEQIAAHARLEQAIQELRRHIDLQFTLLANQLTACRAELAAAHAALKAAQAPGSPQSPQRNPLIH
jgi:hypothetical protein